MTVAAIKFHTREANGRLFKIPMRAYTRRSISAFSEIITRGITHKSHANYLALRENNALSGAFSEESRAAYVPRSGPSREIRKNPGFEAQSDAELRKVKSRRAKG